VAVAVGRGLETSLFGDSFNGRLVIGLALGDEYWKF